MSDPLGPSILAAILLILAAMFYALNTALPHADAADLKKKADSGNPFAGRILRLLNRYDEGYGEIRLSYVLLVCGGYASLISWLMPFTARQLSLSNAVAALLVLVVYSLVAFTLTAIVPGGIANHSPKMTLTVISGPAEWSLRILSPVTGAAFLLGKGLLSPFRIKPIIPSENVTEEEIRMMVDIGGEKGAIEADEKEMIENIFEFNNMNAEDCMVHRKDMTAVDLDAAEDEVLEIITQSGLSRFPVYEDSVDNIVGILTSWDFLINRCSGMPKP
ncbi:MAG: CNNM domain-containing protein, partial [Christensenellales bacterium]|nr:CNNM domain-containing protein [Christensenellales bacterium]